MVTQTRATPEGWTDPRRPSLSPWNSREVIWGANLDGGTVLLGKLAMPRGQKQWVKNEYC